MARYIDVDKLLVKIKNRHTVRYFTPTKEDLLLIDIFEIINTQPTADVVEVRHSKYVFDPRDDEWHCLNCGMPKPSNGGRIKDFEVKRCYHCGDIMEMEEEADE